MNRIGAGPWAGPVNVTPQAPATQPPAPTGDADLSLGTLSPYWTTTGSDHDPGDSCTGPKSFYIIWGGPDGHEKRADEWAAHINTHGGAGEVTHNFRESPGSTGHYEMYGTVNFQGPGRLSINIRGRFGPTWGHMVPARRPLLLRVREAYKQTLPPQSTPGKHLQQAARTNGLPVPRVRGDAHDQNPSLSKSSQGDGGQQPPRMRGRTQLEDPRFPCRTTTPAEAWV